MSSFYQLFYHARNSITGEWIRNHELVISNLKVQRAIKIF